MKVKPYYLKIQPGYTLLAAVFFAQSLFAQALRRPIAAPYAGFGAFSLNHIDAFSFISNQAALARLDNMAAGIYGERRFMLNELNHYTAVIALPTHSGNFGLKTNYSGFSEYNETQLGFAYAKKLGSKAVTGITQSIHFTVNSKDLLVTDDLLNGTGFSFVRENRPSPVTLKKQANTAAAGNLTWYYFSTGDFASKVNKEVNLKKEISRYNNASGKWELANEKTILHIADKIKVLLIIEISKALRYIYIDDKRAAAFEPKENHSGYMYSGGVGYYQSIRDAGIQFFTDFIPSGRTLISYEMTVAQEGSFTNGPASLQCMYKPEVNAYSNGIQVQTIK